MRCLNTLLFIVIFAQTAFPQLLDEKPLSGNFRDIPVISFFDTLEANYPVNFFFKKDWFENDTITINIQNKSIEEVIASVLYGKLYTYKTINGNQYVFLPADEVKILAGEMLNYNRNLTSGKQFILVGNQEAAGKDRTVIVSGIVTDGNTGEPIAGATIKPENIQQGAITNTEGFYKLTIKPGQYTLQVSSIGFENAGYEVKILGSGVMNIELYNKTITIDDIIIYGQRLDRNVSSYHMGLVELDRKEISQLPSISGGKDILKGLTITPGVKSIGEFSSGINVRGGGEDQNLYLINGAPLLNTSHVFGLYSVINPDAVEKLSLYKGHIPALYGERASSVVDIRTRESAPGKMNIKGGIGLFDSRLLMEVPVYKNRVFFNLGGRTSYSNWLLHSLRNHSLMNSEASFYDLNGTLHANFGRNRFALSGYFCNDEFSFNSEVGYNYGSRLGSFNWSFLINSNLASYLTISYSDYRARKEETNSVFLQSTVRSGINYKSLKYRIKYGGFQYHTTDAGFSLIRYEIQPGIREPLNELSLVLPGSLENEQGYEGAIFLNDEIKLNDVITINMGLRYSAYAYMGPGSVAQYSPGMSRDTGNITGYLDYDRNRIIQYYHGIEPRISSRIRINEESSVKIGYNRSIQYISLISNSSVTTPSDIWKLNDPFVKPLISSQYVIGYYHNFFNNAVETSVEIYYKGLKNVIDYKNGARLEMNNNIETQLVNTSGRNYGLEIFLKKNSGKIDGWVSYSYSRSLRKSDGIFAGDIINYNRYYPSSYDRPHDLSIIANFHLDKRLMLSANFSFASGRPISLPEYSYYNGNDALVYFSEKNKYRIPSYHRLDLTFSLDESLRVKKKWKGQWSFSILNVYGRKNAYTVYYKKEMPGSFNNYSQFSLYKLYLIGRMIPTVSYSFIF